MSNKTSVLTKQGKSFLGGLAMFLLGPVTWVIIGYTNLINSGKLASGFNSFCDNVNGEQNPFKLLLLPIKGLSVLIMFILCLALCNHFLTKTIKQKDFPWTFAFIGAIVLDVVIFIFTL